MIIAELERGVHCPSGAVQLVYGLLHPLSNLVLPFRVGNNW